MPLFRFNLLFFTLLSIATLLAHFFIERFQPTGDELLTNQWKTRTSDKSRIDIEKEEHIQISKYQHFNFYHKPCMTN